MIDRETVLYYLGLAAMCMAVVLVVVYIVKPRMVERLDPISRKPRSACGSSTKQIDIAATTLKTIQSKSNVATIAQLTPAKRNPFIWPGELKPKKARIPIEELRPKTIPKLGMIIISQDRRMAFLDQQLVLEGTKHDGYRVD
ncbi:MAG: hypothetical protein JRH15_17635, partial [Deltaproteobacteria bacterium]|nr:hypothetical protein [Deltaproteobacteria bacterium]